MQKILVLFMAIGLLAACKKDKLEKDNAQLIGIDYRKCAHPICGGYWIEINQDTLRFLDFPKDTNIDWEQLNFHTVFPIPVEVNWDWPTDEGLLVAKDLIVVERIEER